MEGFGEKVKQARLARGMSIRELARRAEVSASLISQVERNLANPSAASLLLIANALKLPVDYFFSNSSLAEVTGSSSGDAQDDGPSTTVALETGELSQESPTPPGRSSPVVRLEDRVSLDIAGGVQWQRLTPRHDHTLQFVEVVYDVGSSSTEKLSRHEGREFGLVSQGQLMVELGFEKYILKPGDSISYDSMTPHRLVNIGDVPVIAVWIVMGLP